MKINLDVQSRAEGDAIKIALDDPTTRAIITISGILLELPDVGARRRVLGWFVDQIAPEPEVRTYQMGLRLHDADGTRGE
jgi:hypothetical protein